ncbi:MAG: hypothetical protein R3A10_22255 [Caldilineaceae bacterium]
MVVHRAGPADLEAVLQLEIDLWRHLSRAPVFIRSSSNAAVTRGLPASLKMAARSGWRRAK